MSTVNQIFPTPNALRLESVVTQLISSLYKKRASILDSYKVTEMEVDIINYLQEHEMQKMKEVGEHFDIKLSTLTSTIDKLEKNKLVKRKNSKEDRRVIYIRPTAKGLSLLHELEAYTRDMAEEVTSDMKPNDFAILVGGIEKMLKEIG